MEGNVLHAPWRMDYIRTLDKPAAAGDGRCFLCDAAASQNADQRRDRLVLWITPYSVVLINRYPYTNGHLMVAPLSHDPDLELLTPEQMNDMQVQTSHAVRLLKRAVSAQGFNIGINLGRCAGAGVPGHIHQHVVPRWAGDTNFISVVGETRIVPQAISQLYDELLKTALEMNLTQR